MSQMCIFIGYYESSTKNTLKCSFEFLHARSQKTSPVTSFRVKKYDPVRYRNRTFQKLKTFCIGLRCLHMMQTSIICTGLLSVQPPEADLA